MGDVGSVDGTALPTIEVLARLALAARQAGREIRLERASPALLELLALCGLGEVLPCADEPPDRRRSTTVPDGSGREVVG